MNLDKFPHWIQVAVGSVGGLALLVIAFLDSSVLTFPVINDLLVIYLSTKKPALMPYYALMATLGSVAGCIFLYYLARKGGELAFHKRAGARARRIHEWVNRNAFLSILIPAMLPPPTPFKLFVIGAGVFQVPLRTFTLALLLARGVRYFGVGYLAVRYGSEAGRFLAQHKLEASLIALAVVLAGYLLSRLMFRGAHRQS